MSNKKDFHDLIAEQEIYQLAMDQMTEEPGVCVLITRNNHVSAELKKKYLVMTTNAPMHKLLGRKVTGIKYLKKDGEIVDFKPTPLKYIIAIKRPDTTHYVTSKDGIWLFTTTKRNAYMFDSFKEAMMSKPFNTFGRTSIEAVEI